MPLTTAAVPGADKPDPKPEARTKPAAKSGLADAALSSDPAVQKLMWERGTRESSGDSVAAIDDELRKLGFDV